MKSELAPGAATLAAAVRAVSAVAHDGRSADVALLEAESRQDRSAVRAIALGTLRWYLRLAPAMASLVARPAADIDPQLRALLITAAHQIEHSRGAPEVSVHLAVDAARALGLQRATGFVNAVLRRFVRERESLLAAVDADTATRHAHAEWFVKSVSSAWPEAAEAIFIANNRHPPMTLRVAPFSADAREEYRRELASLGRSAHAVEWSAEALQLEHAVSVSSLPGFESGRVSVQDAGAQLAAHLLDLSPSQRVLDACAAPGGKTAHILQLQPDIDLLAVDVDGERLALVRGTLERIGVEARVLVRDLSRSDALADEAAFDRILLDAPCSSTGVIRRHPDIKLLRRAEDIEHLARMQRRLLENCLSKLAPQGRLVYATCSVLPDENEQVIRAFIESHPEIEALPWPAGVSLPPGAIQLAYGVQLLPGSAADTDGFYYACLGYRGSR